MQYEIIIETIMATLPFIIFALIVQTILLRIMPFLSSPDTQKEKDTIASMQKEEWLCLNCGYQNLYPTCFMCGEEKEKGTIDEENPSNPYVYYDKDEPYYGFYDGET